MASSSGSSTGSTQRRRGPGSGLACTTDSTLINAGARRTFPSIAALAARLERSFEDEVWTNASNDAVLARRGHDDQSLAAGVGSFRSNQLDAVSTTGSNSLGTVLVAAGNAFQDQPLDHTAVCRGIGTEVCVVIVHTITAMLICPTKVHLPGVSGTAEVAVTWTGVQHRASNRTRWKP